MYTRLKVIYRKKTRGTATDRVVTMSEILNPHEECEKPRTVLIEGKPGMGKTTYCKKLVFDWATGKLETEDCFPNYQIVLFIKCRDVMSDLWEAIDDQLLSRDVDEDTREKFFDFIRQNQSDVLLVLDGLDEVPEEKLPMFTEIIQGRVLPNSRVVATARHEAGMKVRKYCNTLLEIEGFTNEDARTFVFKYFKTSEHLAKKLIFQLRNDKNLKDMTVNPLNTALLCLVCEEFEGVFPESRTMLYMEIIQCVLRRYRAKKELPENGDDLIELYENQLKHLGSIALKGLLEDNLDFDKKELGKHAASDLPGFGFLSVQPGGSKLRPTQRYGFLHKSFQEFFAGFYLCCQLISKEISTDSIAADRRYYHQLKEVLPFTFGMLAARCEETVMALIRSIAPQLNQEVNEDVADYLRVVLECINECKNDISNFKVKLAHAFGTFLQIQTVTLERKNINDVIAVILASVLKASTTVKKLDLSGNNIGDAGAAGLSGCLKCTTSLSELYLCDNNIGDAGAAGLGECLKCTTSLSELYLSDNNIGDAGAAALVEGLKCNTSLSKLNLSLNNIGDAGAAALGECLKCCTSLSKLYLFDNNIGDAGAAGLGEGLKCSTSLSVLDLSRNNIGAAGAAALGEALKCITSLSVLKLSGNNIGDAGAAALVEGLKCSTSLSELKFSGNNIGAAGATALGEGLKCITSLSVLKLSDNNIGAAGAAALGEGLKCITSLSVLKLSHSNIGAAGAAALGEALKCITSLSVLDLAHNNIGDGGAAALGEALKCITSLSVLDLSRNNIGDAGAAGLSEGLKCSTSLSMLYLSFNNIGDAGAAGLGEGLKCNKSLKQLFLSSDNISETVKSELSLEHDNRVFFFFVV